MNILLDCTRHIEGDKKRIRVLAAMGRIFLMLFICTLCFSVVILYNLSGQVRLLEDENRVLKEILQDSPVKTDNTKETEVAPVNPGVARSSDKPGFG